MPLSNDPAARRKQLANLKTTAAVTHGARSGALIRQAAAEHLVNLRAQLPSATTEELTVQAIRMAQIERLAAYVEQKGLIRNQREGTVYEAGRLLSQLSTAFERQHAVLLARQQASGSAGTDLATYLAETYGDGQDGDGDA